MGRAKTCDPHVTRWNVILMCLVIQYIRDNSRPPIEYPDKSCSWKTGVHGKTQRHNLYLTLNTDKPNVSQALP